MLNRLVLLWRKFRAWLVFEPEGSTHRPVSYEPYQPSNLHARRYR